MCYKVPTTHTTLDPVATWSVNTHETSNKTRLIRDMYIIHVMYQQIKYVKITFKVAFRAAMSLYDECASAYTFCGTMDNSLARQSCRHMVSAPVYACHILRSRQIQICIHKLTYKIINMGKWVIENLVV